MRFIGTAKAGRCAISCCPRHGADKTRFHSARVTIYCSLLYSWRKRGWPADTILKYLSSPVLHENDRYYWQGHPWRWPVNGDAGDNIQMEIELIVPMAITLEIRFAIREGGHTVGAGTLTSIAERVRTRLLCFKKRRPSGCRKTGWIIAQIKVCVSIAIITSFSCLFW